MTSDRFVRFISLLTAVIPAVAAAAEFAGVPVPVIGWTQNSILYTPLEDVFDIAVSPSGAILLSQVTGGMRQIGLDGRISSVPPGPSRAAFDSQGNAYYYAPYNSVIYKITPSGGNIPLAGFGAAVPLGEGIRAMTAKLPPIQKLAANSRGEVFFAENETHRVWRIDTAGLMRVVAGTGTGGAAGEGGPATRAQLDGPYGLEVDSSGALYIADYFRILKVASDGRLVRLLGPPALLPSVPIDSTRVPEFTIDPAGNVYFSSDGRIQRLSTDGSITTVAGRAERGFHNGCGSVARPNIGDAKTALFDPRILAFDSRGNLLVVESEGPFFALREITPKGEVRLIAGPPPALTGDGGPASSATLSAPHGLAFDRTGNLYIADTANNRIRKIAPDGIIRTIVGDGGPTADIDYSCGADDNRFLRGPEAVAVDADGAVYIADTGKHRVLKLSADGTLTRFAGTGSAGYLLSPVGTPAATIPLDSPRAIAVDRNGAVWVGDNSRRTLKISPGGAILKVIPRVRAHSFSSDAEGNLYLSTGSYSYLVRPEDQLALLAGLGIGTTSAEGDPPVEEPDDVAYLGFGSGLTRDADGTLFHISRAVVNSTSTTCNVTRLPWFFSLPERIAASPQGDVFVSDRAGIVWRLPKLAPDPNSPPTPQISQDAPVRNAGSLLISTKEITELIPVPFGHRLRTYRTLVSPKITPGEIVRITGQCLGPFEAIAAPNGSGVLPLSLGHTRVFFDELPAPLLSVQSGEIFAVTPFGLNATKDIQLRVEVGGVSVKLPLETTAFEPGLFHFLEPDGSATALAGNADGTANSSSNPAKAGSQIWLYATGLGQTDPAGVDGEPAPDLTPRYLVPIRVSIGGAQAEVLYAGPVPGFSGLSQIQVQIPENIFGAIPVILDMGGASFRQTVRLWVMATLPFL